MAIKAKTQDAIADLRQSMMEIIAEDKSLGCSTSNTEDEFEHFFVEAVRMVVADILVPHEGE